VFALSLSAGNAGAADVMNQMTQSGPANTGLTFIYLPLLFSKISTNGIINIFFASIFFLALFFAAVTSLISMVEMATRTLIDCGVVRRRAIVIVASLGFILGIPSALDMSFFINQDWVWGIGLILSGAFISFSIIRYGVDRFRTEIINGYGSDIKIGKWYNYLISILVPIQVVVLILWWMISSASWDREWWNPFHIENAGTAVAQWILVLTIFILLNKKMSERIFRNGEKI
jgi:NSS family neurotransmitter:Na+ symporter